jgi:hypothetical protein
MKCLSRGNVQAPLANKPLATLIPAGDDGKEVLAKRYSTFRPLLIVGAACDRNNWPSSIPFWKLRSRVSLLWSRARRHCPHVSVQIRISGFPNLCIHEHVEL